VEELLAERGIQVDGGFSGSLPCSSTRHAPGDRWSADETYVKVAGRWVYLYRAIDQYGQVIDVLASTSVA
jgi:transposase-like protein